ncbi:MAG: hypothetical protein K5779_00905 [Saccharofermentans sp.]|nr:hypothetical protein [Saccharofermentans sp.]
MRAISPVYPSLGRYFKTVTELANAGCMSRTRAWACLSGRKEFTAQEKTAIANAIIAMINTNELKDIRKDREMERAKDARKDFDKVFRVKKAA